MRRIALWRLVFGLAFVPAALITWADLDTSRDASFVERILAFGLAYLLGLALSALVVGFAVWAYFAARSVWTFMVELFGLRE